uniref:Uncharacterized protein n=1 Tax=Meloidogyne enterolobii TaxID=390850 RepID=A0A6V7VA63_MELEN|nr:unnamed protein product [Meloidogyne enterolobii]
MSIILIFFSIIFLFNLPSFLIYLDYYLILSYNFSFENIQIVVPEIIMSCTLSLIKFLTFY